MGGGEFIVDNLRIKIYAFQKNYTYTFKTNTKISNNNRFCKIKIAICYILSVFHFQKLSFSVINQLSRTHLLTSRSTFSTIYPLFVSRFRRSFPTQNLTMKPFLIHSFRSENAWYRCRVLNIQWFQRAKLLWSLYSYRKHWQSFGVSMCSHFYV